MQALQRRTRSEAELMRRVRRLVNSGAVVLTGNFARFQLRFWPPATIRVVNWNIDRGLQFSGILNFLRGAEADILLLQEVDLHVVAKRPLVGRNREEN